MQLFIEFAPLVLFFLTYKLYGLMQATAVLMVAATVALSISWWRTRRIPLALSISTLCVLVFGGLSLWIDDPYFIKIKPAIVNLLFAFGLGLCRIRNVAVLEKLLGQNIPLPHASWLRLQTLMVGYFIVLAIANELVWRVLGTDIWMQYRTFAVPLMTLCFLTGCIVWFSKKHAAASVLAQTPSEPPVPPASKE